MASTRGSEASVMFDGEITKDLLDDILSRIPLTSLRAIRSTCKGWNALSKNWMLCRAEAKQQFLGFMLNDFKVCSIRFSLHGILTEDGEKFVEPSINEMNNLFNQVEIREIIHCDGLLLWVVRHDTGLVVWNPYLGQTRWIEPINAYNKFDMYALEYDNNKNRNHKILGIFDDYDDDDCSKKSSEYHIYDFKSNTWRVIDVTPQKPIWYYQHTVSLKGNTYFLSARFKMGCIIDDFLICFDFTNERFGPYLPLPSHYCAEDYKALSTVREEQLTVLYNRWNVSKVEIWVTTKIEPNVVSWSCFLNIDVSDLIFKGLSMSFFIDQAKKIAVVFCKNNYKTMFTTSECFSAHIIGEGGYLRKVDLGRAMELKDLPYARTLVCSYIPSLVQINQGQVLSHIRQVQKKEISDQS